MVLSREPLAKRVPSLLNSTEKIISECPNNVATSVLASKFHNFIVRSLDPLAKRVPSLLNAIELTEL